MTLILIQNSNINNILVILANKKKQEVTMLWRLYTRYNLRILQAQYSVTIINESIESKSSLVIQCPSNFHKHLKHRQCTIWHRKSVVLAWKKRPCYFSTTK